MESINFKPCTADPCIFVTGEGADLTIVAVYVDDLIVITKTPETMKKNKRELSSPLQNERSWKTALLFGDFNTV